MQMIDVTVQMLRFRDFLIHSWDDLDLLMSYHDWDDDDHFLTEWLQVNWEFLVERELLANRGFLKSYTYSDLRVTHRDAMATHFVTCVSKNSKELIDDKTKIAIPKEIPLAFGGFVKQMDPGYGCYPPFDFVTAFTLDKKHFYRLQVAYLDFDLCHIKDFSK